MAVWRSLVKGLIFVEKSICQSLGLNRQDVLAFQQAHSGSLFARIYLFAYIHDYICGLAELLERILHHMESIYFLRVLQESACFVEIVKS